MAFRQDVENTKGLNAAYRPGVQALRRIDRMKLTATPKRSLSGSADLDTALRHAFPNAPRWDYVVAWNASNADEMLIWIEVHSASRIGDLEEVQSKFTWLVGWLAYQGRRLRRPKERMRAVWIASGRSAFQKNSPQLKKLVTAGIDFAGGHYVISD